MRRLPLPEVELRVPEPDVLDVVLRRVLQIAAALDVPSLRLAEQERVLEPVEKALDGVVVGLDALDGEQGRDELVRVREGSDGGAEDLDQAVWLFLKLIYLIIKKKVLRLSKILLI